MKILRIAAALAVGALLLTANPTPSAAQNCPAIYARMMQDHAAGSPHYPALRQRYEERCMRGPERAVRPRSERHAQRMGPMCRELRAACLNKERLGERGEGNCRRYRQTCPR